MSSEKKSNSTDKLDLLDVTGTAQNTMSWVQNYIEDITKAPVAKQAAVGGVSGWVVGYVSMKVGKVAATLVGGSLIVMQLAVHQGYIKVDWSRVNKDFEKNARKITKEMESRLKPGVADKAVRFARENAVLAASFIGGVLLGMASS